MCSGLLGLSLSMKAYAQSMEAFSFNKILTPSVESFAISKFGNLSPSLYTGAMTYSLPIYTYRDGDFTIPVSLDYCFEGYIPSKHSGTVGYGWALSCGGIITRKVIGLADDSRPGDQDGAGYSIAISTGQFNPEEEVDSRKWYYAQHYLVSESELASIDVFSDIPLYGGRAETAPDMFSFKFLDYSGEFMLTDDGSVKFFNTSHPSGEFSLDYEFACTEPEETAFSEIRIRTGDGYCYYFGGGHKNLEFSKQSGPGESPFIVTGWKLRKIVAPNCNEVEFVYTEFQKDFSIFEYYTPEIDADVIQGPLVVGDFASSKTLQYTNCNFYHLLSDVLINGKSLLSFGYESKGDFKENESTCFNRVLYPYGFQIYNNFADEKRLSVINVRNISGDIVDEFILSHNYKRGSGANRMFLSSVQSSQKGTHSFEYEISSAKCFPKNDTNGTDYWGFWNGRDTSLSLKSYIKNTAESNPLYDLYDQLNAPSVKGADFSYAKQGGLKKITYPTGGITQIEYEPHDVQKVVCGPNQYKTNTQSVVPGGVRVSKITSISDDINDCTRYRYDGGVLTHMPRYSMYANYKYSGRINQPEEGLASEMKVNIQGVAYTDDCSLLISADPHVTYSSVTTEKSDGSKIVNEFYDINDYNDISMYLQEHMPYSGVEYIPKNNYFSDDDKVFYDGDITFLENLRIALLPDTHDYSRLRGRLKSKMEYDREGSLKTGTEYHYGADIAPVHIQNMFFNALVDYAKVPIRIYAPLLQYETHYEVYDNGHVEEETNYMYNGFDQLSRVTHIKGEKIESDYFKYYWECFPTYGGDVLKSAVCSKVNLVNGNDGQSYVKSHIFYQYNDLLNPSPTSVDIYTSENPILVGESPFDIPENYTKRTVRYTYDEDTGRLIKEEFPGGHYYDYVWDADGRNIVSITKDSEVNSTSFEWVDMVGLRSITYPTLQSKNYIYDSANRLQGIRDGNGNPEFEYQYHMVNE